MTTTTASCAYCGLTDAHDPECPAFSADTFLEAEPIGRPADDDEPIATTVDGRPAIIDGTVPRQPVLVRHQPTANESLKRIAEARDRVGEAEEALAPYNAALRLAKKNLEEAVTAGAVAYWDAHQPPLGDVE